MSNKTEQRILRMLIKAHPPRKKLSAYGRTRQTNAEPAWRKVARLTRSGTSALAAADKITQEYRLGVSSAEVVYLAIRACQKKSSGFILDALHVGASLWPAPHRIDV